MTKARFQAAAVGGTPDDVEAAFYDALHHGEVDKLMACWADEDDIVCVHPGGPRLVGPVAIRAAFDAMFANGTIQAWPQHLRRVESVASAVHSLVERIEVMTSEGPRHAYVVATNVFHKTAQGWRMVVHHASPGTEHAAEASVDAAQVLH
jgi:ketosteroid isomerase-like protein